MRFALVHGTKAEAAPGLKGTCAHCASAMIAKCGRVKVWHWSHKAAPPCDPWWESETEWHRQWKNLFPVEWQEIGHVDSITGERHIADVKNPFGLVVEFQHSPLKPDEMQAREAFYKEMVWVVDGRRGELDSAYFNMSLGRQLQANPLAYGLYWMGKSRLLHNWGEAKAKVYLDFGEDVLWRLIVFDPIKKTGAVGPIPRETFIEDCRSGTTFRVAYRDQASPA